MAATQQPIDRSLMRMTTVSAILVAVLVALAPPFAYHRNAYRFQSGELAAAAGVKARLVSDLASRSPTLWRYQTDRINDALRHADERVDGVIRVVDRDGTTIVERNLHGVEPAAPILRQRVPILDSGHPAGELVFERSLRGLWQETLIVAVVSSLLAGCVFVGMRALPLRALRRALARAAHLAAHDPLTDLPNRVLFADRLAQAMAYADRRDDHVALLCIDLDKFKDVNDTLGHAAGDRLLQEVASRLTGCLRSTDTLARLGGDEFAIVQYGLKPPDQGAVTAQRILEVMAAPVRFDGHEILVGTSIGVANYPEDGRDGEALLQSADTALYRAKADGRGNAQFFEESMNVQLRTRKTLEAGLRRALAEDLFTLHYQPQNEVATGRLIGVEALLRWHDEELGNPRPEEFIPIAEETGLILPLGDWVLRRACIDALAWPSLKVAVNLSPIQFKQHDLADRVALILRETGLPARRLELEITEGVLLKDTEHTLAILHQLKDVGVTIAMDDFGTGYSSLAYLRRFPFDKLKVDRSFIRDLGETEEAAAIVQAIVGLGRSLNMRANAEGVETEAQAAWLSRAGCDEIQGYLFGKPAPAAAISALVMSSAPNSINSPVAELTD